MNAATKRRIQVASFSMDDVARGHIGAMVLGTLMMAGAGLLGYSAHLNARAVESSAGAARLLVAQSDDVLRGTRFFGAGGSERLGAAQKQSGAVSQAFADLASNANSAFVLPSIKQPAANAYTSWSALTGAMDALASVTTGAFELSESLSRSLPSFASLLKRIEASGRQTGQLARAHESAVRLYTYSEAGFGAASVARVDYDLQVVLSDLAQTELKADAAFVEPLLTLVRTAASKKPTKEQLTAAMESAMAGKTAAESLQAAAAQSGASSYLGLAAASTALLGFVCFVLGLRSASADFSRRYARAIQQFRGDETAREKIAQSLRSAVAGSLDVDMAGVAENSDLAELADLIGELLSRIRSTLGDVQAVVSAGMRQGEVVLQHASTAQELGARASTDIQRAVDELRNSAAAAEALTHDSEALVTAASEAASRSADATRVAQDAASRLEAMRDGLQDTAKRIKRLGERTQEINGVVDWMELLSEQINVLALNASLEAERAGDAGQGFRRVAREVQQLASRSEEALERISSLVQGVQSDARSAAESVEKSTTQIVSGANVGAVSNALMSVLAPLSHSIVAMAEGLRVGVKSNAQAVVDGAHVATGASAGVRDMVDCVTSLRDPVESGHGRFAAGIRSLAAAGVVA